MGRERSSGWEKTKTVEDVLHGARMRVTRGRLAVFETLESLGGHRSADEVHRALADERRPVSRASVFGTLEVLSRLGLVMAADAGPGRALYEAGSLWHHHAVCRACGGVSDVECVVGSKPCLGASGDWGVVDEAQIIFRGVCRTCLEGGSKGDKTSKKSRPQKRIETNKKNQTNKRRSS